MPLIPLKALCEELGQKPKNLENFKSPPFPKSQYSKFFYTSHL
jgi:hypothetical protein